MSNLKDLRLQTAKARSALSEKHVPSRVWNAYVWKNWEGHSRWDKQRIIQQGYERNAPMYAAANIVAQTCADIDVHVEVEKRGEVHHTKRHPILDALERNDSRQELIEKLVLYLVVTGEAYGHIVYSKAPGVKKRPLGVICLPSQHVTPVQGDQYAPIQYYKLQNRTTEKIWPDEMIYIFKPDLNNPFKGMSPGIPLAELIDLNNAGITWNKNVALAGGVPPIVAKSPGGMQKEEAREIIDNYQEQGGAQNAHRLRIIGGDLELQEMGTDPHDAEWKEAVLMSMRMIFMAFGVSSSLMNDAANKTYNNVKDSRKALYIDGCLPIIDRVYKRISLSMRHCYDDNPLIKVDRDSIEALQEENKSKAEWLYQGKDRGIFTGNQVRTKLGEPTGSDPALDEYIITNQASQTKEPGKSPQEPISNTNGQENGKPEPETEYN